MSELKTKIIYSTSINTWYNQALEEYLFRNLDNNEIIIYLWQNGNSIIIGRNQNPWKESKCNKLEKDRGKLARRFSGGGAVYHDLGNLNYTFIMPRKIYNINKQLSVILKAVKQAGINARISEKKDLIVNGKKFSGNAFYLSPEKVYHHGTILINSDLEKLDNYLQRESIKIKSKGIASIKSKVINLSDLNINLDITKMQSFIKSSFIEEYGAPEFCDKLDPEGMNELVDHYNHFSSWYWRYGVSPKFSITYNNIFDWGGVKLDITFKNSKIIEAEVFSASIDDKIKTRFVNNIVGLSFKKEELMKTLNITNKKTRETRIIGDIKNWIIEQIPFSY